MDDELDDAINIHLHKRNGRYYFISNNSSSISFFGTIYTKANFDDSFSATASNGSSVHDCSRNDITPL